MRSEKMIKKRQKTIKTPEGNLARINRDYGNISFYHDELPNRSYDYLESIDRDLKKIRDER